MGTWEKKFSKTIETRGSNPMFIDYKKRDVTLEESSRYVMVLQKILFKKQKTSRLTNKRDYTSVLLVILDFYLYNI